ncbi:MAG TPA: NusG domain II-containing protein, partial [Bacillota bacterium]|nr:NusG domain II-containing protein [Bacillota bacterium]
GKVTTDMEALYLVDEYARDHQIVGIKLQVDNNAISVVYQESPKDLCELQGASDSHLEPIVCLPNELVIDIYTNLESDVFVPDSVLE